MNGCYMIGTMGRMEGVSNLPQIPVPVIVGHLNRAYGYRNCDRLDIGTPVYEDKRGYYMYITLTESRKIIVYHYNRDKDNSSLFTPFSHHVDFLPQPVLDYSRLI